MTKLQGWCVGTIFRRAQRIEGNFAKSGFETIVRLKERALDDGRAYHQRIIVRSYQRDAEDIVDKLEPGVRVIVQGEVDAKVSESDGSVFANPRIIGRVEIIDADEQPEPAYG